MMAIGKCATGEAVITPAFKLRTNHVIHTVAPIFAQHKEADVWRLLANCYRNSLMLAAQYDAKSIAFPSIGTGVYGIPIERACEVAIATVRPAWRIVMRTWYVPAWRYAWCSVKKRSNSLAPAWNGGQSDVRSLRAPSSQSHSTSGQ